MIQAHPALGPGWSTLVVLMAFGKAHRGLRYGVRAIP